MPVSLLTGQQARWTVSQELPGLLGEHSNVCTFICSLGPNRALSGSARNYAAHFPKQLMPRA